MSGSERLVRHLVFQNYQNNNTGTPKEEIVKQAVNFGVDENDAWDHIWDLRACAEIYEIRPGLLIPVIERPSDNVIEL